MFDPHPRMGAATSVFVPRVSKFRHQVALQDVDVMSETTEEK